MPEAMSCSRAATTRMTEVRVRAAGDACARVRAAGACAAGRGSHRDLCDGSAATVPSRLNLFLPGSTGDCGPSSRGSERGDDVRCAMDSCGLNGGLNFVWASVSCSCATAVRPAMITAGVVRGR